jgi:hypothetical protein
MEKEKKEQPSRARKPFRKPRLRIYGHISAITQAGGMAAKDNPKSPSSRTGV